MQITDLTRINELFASTIKVWMLPIIPSNKDKMEYRISKRLKVNIF
jgi:hypothetical protein